VHPFFEPATPHLFAHRGAAGEAPENTLAAFELAVRAGVAFLEMDCHATRDGEVVICHDAALDRTTDGHGPICEHDFADLEKLDAGYRFERAGQHPFRSQGVRIPRLGEVLEAFPGLRINLEVKQDEPDILEAVLRDIRAAEASHRVLLAAESDAIMDRIHARDAETAIGSCVGDALAFYAALDADAIGSFRPRGQALQIPTSFGDRDLVTPQSIAAAHEVGLFMHVWTINDPAEMRRLLDLGVDGVMSDYPARLLEVAASL